MSSTQRITVKLRYFATFRELTEKKEEAIQLPLGSTIKVALDWLIEAYGAKMKDFLYEEEGKLRRHFTVMVNGEDLEPSSMNSRPLKEGDEVVVLPPVGGGSSIFKSMNSPKIYLESYGCSASLADAEMIAGILGQGSFERAQRAEDADLSIIVTCTVKTPTAQRMVHRIRGLTRLGRPLVVAGCMPKTEPDTIRRINPRASLLGPQALHGVLDTVRRTLEGETVNLLDDLRSPKVGLPRVRGNRIVHIVEIGQGCLGRCTFCQVKLAKGGLKSYPEPLILQEVERAVVEGCREVWITSQDNACYGRDTGTDLPSLIDKVCAIEGDFFVRVGMMNPAHLLSSILDRLVESYSNAKVFKFLHVPVQSGSDRILGLMQRRYTGEDFLSLVDRVRRRIPDLTLATDIIVGFPTESEEDFAMTTRLLERARPDVVNLTRFGPRPGTGAARMPKIDPRTVKERSAEAHHTVKRIARERNGRWLGWEGKVLIDEMAKGGGVVGRNYAYKPVFIKGDLCLGSFARVEVTDVTAACLRGRHLVGE